MGVARPVSTRRPGIRKVTGSKEPVRDLDYVRLNRALNNGVARYEAKRDQLMAEGKAGDVGALCILWERWGFRLPAVEGRLSMTLPWMRR